MSLDIHYHTCNFGTRVAKRNPFTGKMQSFSAADTLTAAERKAVLNLLKKAGAARPDKLGDYVVSLPDGGSADVRPFEEEDPHSWAGLLVSLRALSPGMARLLWDLCQVGNMAAIPVLKDGRDIVLVASEEHRRQASARWSSPTVVDSPDEFRRLLGSETPQPVQEQVKETQQPICTSGSRGASPDGESILDLRAEAADIHDYITSRVAVFDPRANAGPGEAQAVTMVSAGFEYDQSGWFALVFDRRPDAGHDGEWTLYLEGNTLDRPQWVAARERNEEYPIRARGEDGVIRELPPGSHFGWLLGRMLVGVLQQAERDGLFARLPHAERFRLGLEEFHGSLGWDSETGYGGKPE
jgi:hypothetical protein